MAARTVLYAGRAELTLFDVDVAATSLERRGTVDRLPSRTRSS